MSGGARSGVVVPGHKYAAWSHCSWLRPIGSIVPKKPICSVGYAALAALMALTNAIKIVDDLAGACSECCRRRWASHIPRREGPASSFRYR